MSVADILEQAKLLSPHEQEELAKLLMDWMETAPLKPPHRLSELRGLGKEIWQGMDAQEYVHSLREEWDEHR